jgi:hypothetical protein
LAVDSRDTPAPGEEEAMIDEKIEELWTTTRKLMEEGTLEEHLPEQMDFFARQILPLLAAERYDKRGFSTSDNAPSVNSRRETSERGESSPKWRDRIMADSAGKGSRRDSPGSWSG